MQKYEITNIPEQETPDLGPSLFQNTQRSLNEAVNYSAHTLLSMQHDNGYWWFTLQANETIGAEFIFLMYFLDQVDKKTEAGICHRILDVQRPDGTWSLYHDGPDDLSTTIECYFALKLGGHDIHSDYMSKAREYILSKGGLTTSRVFTKIHLAMFGLVPWHACPEMPAELMLLPNWFPINIYEFSSWARASIVPLLIFMSKKPVKELKGFDLEELFCEPKNRRNYSFKTDKGFFSKANLFLQIDKLLKVYDKIPFKPLRNHAINKCFKWTWEHIQHTEDIYPALAYGALAFKALNYSNDSKQIKTPFKALKAFQQNYATLDAPALCYNLEGKEFRPKRVHGEYPTHQQCCISPVWDTPWALMALLESGISPSHPNLIKSGHWLISKQITELKGDWAVKNPNVEPGGWSFEFKNDYFPDVDDAVEVIQVLQRIALPEKEKEDSIKKGMKWILSMQNNDGGWGAFDKNQNLTIVNEIPFSDHGACLDPSTPDITGRIIELLAKRGFSLNDEPVKKALNFLQKNQEDLGAWFGRWGINYIYGTWCVLTGLSELGWHPLGSQVKKATAWLKQIQNIDGGFGESPESYNKKTYVNWKESVPSQTAWALMGLIAGGEASSTAAKKAADYLINKMNLEGSWDEEAYTGTGFPGHFYIRYHGYRHYFPTLALARYKNATS